MSREFTREGYPSGAGVLAELRRRDPDRYGEVERLGYTPGSAPGATVEEIADMVHAALVDIAAGNGRDIDPSL